MMYSSWKHALQLCALVAVVGLSSCETKPAAQEAAATTSPAATDSTATTPAVTAAYICPMGCEGSASDKPGKCPVCEMDLEPNPAAKSATKL
ncbi:heavy metal-binding domain-containing protein [Hymenobacter swuensis]|uniref:Heavy metal binding domain-containing protein n=1 Tax=Hymenobacter swuensis DY53 TaxID=1227739 RepID=W8EZ49_9BACT|nr:heavy metal-binding domain-containing protein [Hymenobacter swuensis]AHJ95621.1 hypothetical protein Hsw_0026 [Hymenobacter swuensis DY53]